MMETIVHVISAIAAGTIILSMIFVVAASLWLMYKLWMMPDKLWIAILSKPNKENFDNIIWYMKK